ncbi:MAG: DUF4157 domain-containing protein [Anaerolineaceae bacterium]|nr:DUF4157 domain-containing protein [Anaerolineaceae bacterium]
MGYTFDRRKINKKNKFPDDQTAQVKREMLPNSMVRRIMEDPAAEKEADRLSQGITSSTPEDIMREMGSRLNADFSNVRFHSDANSMNKSQAMGARAWAQGRDVYFGKGGFSPSVAAHELVHTVQQGAVQGNVSQSMPMGTVQMIPNNEGDEEEIHPDYTLKEPQIETKLLEIFNSSDIGRKVYQRMEKKLKKMIEKGTKGGKNLPHYSKEYGIKFLAWASGKDYSSKGILTTIMQKNISDKDAAKDAAYEYEQYIDMLSGRLGKHGLEDVASQVFGSLPLGEDNKRAYNTQMPEEGENSFNPNQIRELTRIQQQIDGAKDAQSAYRIFADYTGNPGGKYMDQFGTDLDLSLFKKKLKHMTRVVYDYPELRGNIGDMNTINPKSTQVMSEEGSVGGRDKIGISYNAHMDRKGQEGEAEREKYRKEDLQIRRFNAPNTNYAGTHELGHGLASLLPNSGSRTQDLIDQNTGKNEADIIKTVVDTKNVLDDREKKDVKQYYKDQKIKGVLPVLKGQIDTKNSKFYENNQTSKYGSTAPVEMFAEAFHDVYANGKDAKKMSMEIVKEYERRQTKLTEQKFNKKKKRGFFRRFMDFFKF